MGTISDPYTSIDDVKQHYFIIIIMSTQFIALRLNALNFRMTDQVTQSLSLSDWYHNAKDTEMLFNFLYQKTADCIFGGAHIIYIIPTIRQLFCYFPTIIIIKLHNRIIKMTQLKAYNNVKNVPFFFFHQWN